MIVIVMGVSGSGKSTVGTAVADILGWPFVDGDALHPAANLEKMTRGIPLTDADRAPWLEAIGQVLDVWIRSGKDGVVACSALKRAYRETLRDDRPGVWFAFLDIDSALLESRVARRRGHFMPSALLSSQLATLESPGADERAVTIRLDHETSSPRATAAQVVRALAEAWKTEG